MNSFALKILAFLTMFIDHAGILLFQNNALMRLIGRISFPLFALFIAEGFIHSKNQLLYLKRLLILAIISQPFFYIFYSLVGIESKWNILFTLSLALALLISVKRARFVYTMLTVATIVVFEYFTIGFEYGIYGIAIVLAFYIFRTKSKFFGLSAFIILTIATSLVNNPESPTLQIMALLALVPILMYNGEQGKKIPKLLLYSLYPVHLALFSIIYLAFF